MSFERVSCCTCSLGPALHVDRARGIGKYKTNDDRHGLSTAGDCNRCPTGHRHGHDHGHSCTGHNRSHGDVHHSTASDSNGCRSAARDGDGHRSAARDGHRSAARDGDGHRSAASDSDALVPIGGDASSDGDHRISFSGPCDGRSFPPASH